MKGHTVNTSKLNLIPLSLASLTILTGLILSSTTTSATDDSVVDEINITVPVSCTLSGTGMDTHNANINNGLYVPDIGTTTLHAFCNDNEGFAIYAAGYTGNEVGGTNSNKLVGTTASNNATIESGTAITAGNPDISNWAMKLAITQDSGDVAGTNAFTIDSAPNVDLPSQAESGATEAPFSSYHVVPNEYIKVAHKNSGTDMTDTTGGDSGEYYVLAQQYGGESFGYNEMDATDVSSLQYNLSSPLSGAYGANTITNQNDSGFYLSSTFYSDSLVYVLETHSSFIIYNVLGRENGFSMRCLVSE